MTKMKLLILLLFFGLSHCHAQQLKFEELIKSFKEFKSRDLISFEKAVQNDADLMSREQALKFIYSNDVSKLECITQTYDMMTEKKGPIVKEERLPSKCILVKIDNYYLAAYSSYECHDPEKPQQAFLTLIVVNKKYEMFDKIVVYKSTGDFTEIMGLLNPENGLIFFSWVS